MNKSLKLHGKLGISNSSLILKHSLNKFNGAMDTNGSYVNIEEEQAEGTGFNLFTH